MNAQPLPLTIAQPGKDVRVHTVRANGLSQRLREIGILEGRTVRIITNNDPLICQVGNCRFGLCRRIADFVLVEPEPLSKS